MAITPEELQILCDTTVKLVELRRRNCPHLSIETIAPEIMGSLLAAVLRTREPGRPSTAIDYAEHAARQAAKMASVAETVRAAMNRQFSDV